MIQDPEETIRKLEGELALCRRKIRELSSERNALLQEIALLNSQIDELLKKKKN